MAHRQWKRFVQQWRSRVLDRAGYRCEFPGCGRGEPLEAHHVIPRSVRKDLVLDDANGRALCPTHHRWVTDNPAAAAEMGLHGYSWDEPCEVADRFDRWSPREAS